MTSIWEKKYLTLLQKSPKTKDEIEQMIHAGNEFKRELQSETEYLLKDIKNNGLIIDSVYDLVNTSQSYPEAIEPLCKHLSGNYHIRNKEGIIRALGVKESGIKEVKSLVNEYGKVDDDNLNWTIIMSIHNILRPQKIKDLLAQTDDKDHFIIELIKNKKMSLNNFEKFFKESKSQF